MTYHSLWAALLTGNSDAQGHGSPSDEIRDAGGRIPNLWFADLDPDDPPPQRFHVEVYAAPKDAEQRIAAAVAAGGTVVDDTKRRRSPSSPARTETPESSASTPLR